jgi:hypothetical protein
MLELGRTTTTSPSTSEEGILAAVALLAYGWQCFRIASERAGVQKKYINSFEW